MAHRSSVDTQQARLVRRLRPLYPELSSDEFDRMVARIAEIELFGTGAGPVDIDAAGRRPRVPAAPSQPMAS